MANKKSDLKKGRLSNKDFETFKKNIHLSDDELAKKLKRSISFIEKTRKRVYPNKKTGKWNKVDVETLKLNNKNMSIEELSRLLNRTESAVKSKLDNLIPGTGDKPVTKPENIEEVEVDLSPLELDEEDHDLDCCGQNCCDHKNNAEKKEPKKHWFIRFLLWFKVW